MRTFLRTLKRFGADESGIFAVIFGVMAIVLVALAGAAVDYTAMETARTRAQIALDSAALGLAPTIYSDDVTEQQLAATAQRLIAERLDNDPTVTIEVDAAETDLDNGTLRLTGRVTVPMAFVQLVGVPTLTATIVSEATKGSINLEVSVALDNTGSMGGDIDFLAEGLSGLIDLVVSDVQLPTYSKMALAPYSEQVNAGKYAASIRGAIPAVPIQSTYWSGPLVDLIGATKANPVVVTTSTSHGYSNGDIVYISGVSGMTTLNSKFYRVANKTATTFALQTTAGANVDGTKYGTFTVNNSNDKVRRCLTWVSASSACQIYVDSDNHGFKTGDYIRTDGNVSNSTYRNKYYTVTRVNKDVYTLDGITSTSATNPLSSNGAAWCTQYGCEWYRFNRKSGGTATYRISPCITERLTRTYTEDPPSTELMGASYDNGSGTCDIDQPFTPLTSDKDKLHEEAEDMGIFGSTAGHIGTAWAWYLLSPEWGYLWDDEESRPAAYDEPNTLKVAILMTDGDYNTQFCNGVVSTNIADCETPASSTNQARTLCTEMKKAGIIVYTVGFRIRKNTTQAKTMSDCATDATKAFLPANGAALVADFEEIGQNITDLRLSY
ncbi:MAG: ubiquitin-activating E1 FCCH domain-containing protein [Devosia sp.]